MPSLYEFFIIYLRGNKDTWLSKKRLQDLALDRGYGTMQIRRVLSELKEDVRIGSLWNSKKRQEEFIYYEMSDEEIASRKADMKWFDELPG